MRRRVRVISISFGLVACVSGFFIGTIDKASAEDTLFNADTTNIQPPVSYSVPTEVDSPVKEPSAYENYMLMQPGSGLDIPVYYDFLEEDGRLQGGQVSVPQPSLAEVPVQPPPTESFNFVTVVDNGPVENRVNLVLLGDGYTASDLTAYAEAVNNVVNGFFGEDPFFDYTNYFNVHRVDVISNESGVDEPDYGIYKDTALDMTFNCSGIARLLCVNLSKAFAAASVAPYADQILAMANTSRYGGAGYPDVTTLAGNNSSTIELALHEMGHSFGNLGDEYDYGGFATYTGAEPSEANVSIYTAQEQLGQEMKWFRWLDLPHIDTFEGAKYSLYGIYRPTSNSKMRALSRPFEEVNSERLVVEIYKIVSPIDDAYPSSPDPLPFDTTFFVTSMQPTSYSLDTQWYINGVAVAGATSATFIAAEQSISCGINDISVTVTDNTSRVRDVTARATWMTETRQWQIGDFNDVDGDGLMCEVDNCPTIANPTQDDIDGDFIGDVCDTDIDGDGLTNLEEYGLGTDPQNNDTDNDGVHDGFDGYPLDDQLNLCLSLVRNALTQANFSTVQAAVDDSNALDYDMIQITAAGFEEDVVYDRNTILTLSGGYYCNFSANPSASSIHSLTIRNGTTIVENLLIK